MKKYYTENNVLNVLLFTLGIGLLVCFTLRLWVPVVVICGILIFNLIYFSVNNLSRLIVFAMVLSFSPKSLYIGYPFLVLMFIYAVITNIFNNRHIYRADAITASWAFIILLGGVTIYKWQYPWLGIQWYMALAVLPLMIYLIIRSINRTDMLWIIQQGLPSIYTTIVAFTFIQILVLLADQDFAINTHNIMKFHGLSLPGNGSNRLAGILAFVAILGFTSYPICKGAWVKNLVLSATAIFALIFSFVIMSRGAILALIAATIAFIFIKLKKQQRTPKISKVAIILLTIIIIAFSIKPFIDIMSYRMQIAKFDYASIYRLILWYNSIVLIIQNPILGSGPGQHPFEILNESHEDPHNIVLRYGVDFGGISILFLLLILVYPLFILYKINKKDKIIGQFLIGVFIPPTIYIITHSLMEYLISSRGFSPFFWFYWAIFIVIVKDSMLTRKLYHIYIENTGDKNRKHDCV
jgi:O-antigen ligase